MRFGLSVIAILSIFGTCAAEVGLGGRTPEFPWAQDKDRVRRSFAGPSEIDDVGGKTPHHKKDPKLPPMPVAYADWHCGSNDLSKHVTFTEVSDTCPAYADKLNHCCAVHDDCYGQQRGQAVCDNQFNLCNKAAVRLPTSQAIRCRPQLDLAHTVLYWFGDEAYSHSDYSDPEIHSHHAQVIEYSPETTPSIERNFNELYGMCSFINITLSSCANNFNICQRNKPLDICAETLCECMLDASAVNTHKNKANCTGMMTSTCAMVLDYATERLHVVPKPVNWIFVTICLVSVVGVIGIISFYSYYAKRVNTRKDHLEDGKYVHIQNVDSARSINPLLISE